MGWFYERPKHRPHKLTKKDMEIAKGLPVLILAVIFWPFTLIYLLVKMLKHH